jgi:acetyltransferase-like isoleucine patch superfamily enzyme
MTNQAYRLPFRKIGKDVLVWGKAQIISPEVITVGDSVIIDDFVFLMGGQETILGSFIHIGAFSSLSGGGRLIMEDFSGLSGGTHVYTGNEHYLGGSLTNPAVPPPYRVPIRSFVHLKKHSIVGANSTIFPGVTIGEGAVIGAHSLVTKDCDPWTIYVGNPARPLRKRPQERILELERQLRADLYDPEGRYISKMERRVFCEE